jgi:phosphoglycolate phosphatase
MGIAKYRIPFVMAAGKAKLREVIDQVPLSVEFIKLLAQLAASYDLGIVTTNSSKNVQKFLSKHQVSTFDFVYADARLLGKSRVLKKAVKKQHLDKATTIYVGDEIRDIKAAKTVGIAVIAVCWGYNNKISLEACEPDYLVEDLAGLEAAIGDFFK